MFVWVRVTDDSEGESYFTLRPSHDQLMDLPPRSSGFEVVSLLKTAACFIHIRYSMPANNHIKAFRYFIIQALHRYCTPARHGTRN